LSICAASGMTDKSDSNPIFTKTFPTLFIIAP
jgi:hypothetical protein